MGAAVSDYDEMLALGMDLRGQGRSFSVASLRADSLTPELVAQLAAGGQRTLTVAPEAGSERMRRIINKGIQEEDIFRAVALASSSGMPPMRPGIHVCKPSCASVRVMGRASAFGVAKNANASSRPVPPIESQPGSGACNCTTVTR